MNINVIRLRTVLDDREESIISDNTNFLEEINNDLMNDDLLLLENAKESLFSLVFVETGGSEEKFLKIFPTLQAPILLISNGKNNSLPASFEIKTYCETHGVEAYITTGKEEDCANEIRHFARLKHAIASLTGARLGVIGEPSGWLISSKMDSQEVKAYFGLDLIDISMEELMREIDKHEMGSVPHFSFLSKKFSNQEVLNGACYIYGALKRLVNKYHLSAFTIRCFDLLGRYKNTACLALALLNEQGIISTCEGDVPSLLTMYMLYALTGRPSFQANPSSIDMDKNTLLLAHCTVPFNMISRYELMTHFESGLGIGIKGLMPEDKISICKLFLNEGKLVDNSFIASGKIIENCSLPGYCRTQIRVQLDQYSMFALFQKNFGNHLIITYADVEEDFYALLTYYEKKNKKPETK